MGSQGDSGQRGAAASVDADGAALAAAVRSVLARLDVHAERARTHVPGSPPEGPEPAAPSPGPPPARSPPSTR